MGPCNNNHNGLFRIYGCRLIYVLIYFKYFISLINILLIKLFIYYIFRNVAYSK